jgi:putative spermidine/putrescine transport system ATP-binding protein
VASAGTPDVSVSALRKHYGEVKAVDGVDLDVAGGEFFTMLGPSGSGKTTTLRLIAGFERPDGGVVRLRGQDVSSLPPFARDVNTVFQDYALFPHMTVQQNVEYGLRVKRVPKAERRRRADEALRLVQLADHARRKPGQLLQIELKQVQQELGLTFVYVTHDQEEALTMSDRIAVFNEGKIEQVGTPAEMYEHPRTEFVAGFIGTSNLLDRDGRRFTVRPEKIRMLPGDGAEGEPGVVRAAVYLGAVTRFVVALDRGGELVALQQNLEVSSSGVRAMEGKRVRLLWSPDVEFVIKEGS